MKNNSTLRIDEQDSTINDSVPRVDDEIATVNDSKATVDSPESADNNQNLGVNDDLAACSVASEELIVTSDELPAFNDHQQTFITTINKDSLTKVPNNNGPDPGRASESFVFPARRSVSIVSLCQIILQPIFNAVEQFQNRKEEDTQNSLQLLPVRNKINKRYTR